MKNLITLVVFVALIGGVYGLAKMHVLPLDGVAKSSPAAKKLLLEMKLIKPDAAKAKTPAGPGATALEPDPLAAEKAQLAASQAAVDLEKQQLDRKLAAPAPPPVPVITQTAPHMVEIYEAMGSDDVAALFAKQPDSVVVSALIAMDTKKAAKALAAMPPDRAVKLTALMNRAMATPPNSPQQPTP